jgi:hypothetical protein
MSDKKPTRQELLEEIARKCGIVIPYVTATLSPTIRSERDKDWIEVHAGRAGSSCNQLESILKLVKELEERKQ